MTNPARFALLPIYQGTSYEAPLPRYTVPYKTRWECGRLVDACSGAVVPDADKTPEDYTGCSAVAQFLRGSDPEEVIFELTSADDEIILDGDTLTLVMDAAYTAALELGDTPPAWSECIVRITVTRPSGAVEPQYELTVSLRPWSEP